VIAAERADYRSQGWMLAKGTVHILPRADALDIAFRFDSLHDRRMRERPVELMAAPRAPQDMGYRDLSRFIEALDRSGGDANELKVERALKIAVPITCIIIALFGAPLATSTRRGGAAYGIGVSLATTVIFLVLIQLTKAVGGKGLLPPDIAAWAPNILFGIVGLVMLARVRT
jgi:lipopolysaccharide export system permease protein